MSDRFTNDASSARPLPGGPASAPRHGTAVRLGRVTKTFGRGETSVQALKGIDLEAREGELMMIVGPSGCGKTTLLSVIAGTLEFEDGDVSVFEHHLHAMRPAEVTAFRRRHIGFIFQSFNLVPTLSVIENVCVPLLINGRKRRDSERLALATLERVGIPGKRAGDSPLNLSGGQLQRVAIARALVHEPRLVICDEPTSALDRENGRKIMAMMRDVARAPGRCVIVVTHDNRIFQFADRIAEMDDGRVSCIHENPGTYTGGDHL